MRRPRDPFCTQPGHTGPLRPSETGRPIPYIDQVALDFPELTIVCGHIGYPWTAEMIAVADTHPNIYIDTSAYAAHRYPAELVEYLKGCGRRKVLFGTNCPMMTAARRVGVSHGAIIHWIARGWLVARRGLNDQWCIPFGPDVEDACLQRASRSAHIHQPDTTDPQADYELTVAEVAVVLGISTNVVYYWIERHHVHARRGAGGRLFVSFGIEVEAACRARVAASVHIKPVPQPQTPRSMREEAV